MNIIKRTSKTNEVQKALSVLTSKFGREIISRTIEEMKLVADFPKVELVHHPVSFEEAREYYLISNYFNDLSPRTQKAYRSELKQYSNHLSACVKGPITLDHACDPEILLRYLEKYQGSNTHPKKCAFLRNLLRIPLKRFYDRDLDQDLVDRLKVNFERKHNPKWFNKVQMAELLSLAQCTNIGHRNYAILWTFLASGIRINELVNLTIGDIKIANEQILVLPKSKPRRSNSNRKVPRQISKLGLVILMDYIEFKFKFNLAGDPDKDYDDLYVFSKDYGNKPLSGRAVELMIKGLINRAESISKDEKANYTTHSLRHTYAMYALESGLDIYTIARLLGHHSIKSTEFYLDLKDSQLMKAINKIDFAKEELAKIEERMDSIWKSQ